MFIVEECVNHLSIVGFQRNYILYVQLYAIDHYCLSIPLLHQNNYLPKNNFEVY